MNDEGRSLLRGRAWEYEAGYSILAGEWVVRMAEPTGPNVSAPLKVCRTKLGAEFSAWRRNAWRRFRGS